MVVHSTEEREREKPPYSTASELSHTGDSLAVILIIEYRAVVRRSYAGRETIANDNPYYSPKGTLSIIMFGHRTCDPGPRPFSPSVGTRRRVFSRKI